MFTLTFTPSALEDLNYLTKAAQSTVLAAINQRLPFEPLVETRHRKSLAPNVLAGWELRVGDYRVFYDADVAANVVTIKGAGWKEHNKLFIRGKEYKL